MLNIQRSISKSEPRRRRSDDLEQALNARVQPQFLGSLVPVPNAGLCEGLPKKPHVFKGKAHLPHGRNF